MDGVYDWDNLAVGSLSLCSRTGIEGLLYYTRYQDRGRQQEVYDIILISFMPIFQAAEAIHLPMRSQDSGNYSRDSVPRRCKSLVRNVQQQQQQ